MFTSVKLLPLSRYQTFLPPPKVFYSLSAIYPFLHDLMLGSLYYHFAGSYLPANAHAHDNFESSGKLGWHSVIMATFTPLNFPLCWWSATEPRHLLQAQEELGLFYPDLNLRIRGSSSFHSVPESQHQSQLLFCLWHVFIASLWRPNKFSHWWNPWQPASWSELCGTYMYHNRV